jgi:hypothetical protein
MDMIAALAYKFHWTATELQDMTVSELVFWYGKLTSIINAEKDAIKS